MQFQLLDAPLIPQLESWFDDAQTQRYLGGRAWLSRALTLMHSAPGVEYRGRIIQSRFVWIAFENQTPMCLIDVEIYDDATAGFAFVVAPEHRNHGVGRRALLKLEKRDELRAVEKWIGGVEADNLTSHNCLRAAGFTIAEEVDDEEMLRIEKSLRA